MKKIILFITFCSCTFVAFTQGQPPRQVAPTGSRMVPMFIEDITGKPFMNMKIEGIEGTPFLFEDWNWGAVKFRNNKFAKDVSLHFNVYNNKLYFKRLEEQLEFIEPVHEFMIGYLADGDSAAVLYRSGYPRIDDNTEETFYEVLVDGEISLLKFRYKTISEYKPYNQPERKKFMDKEQLFIYTDKKLTRIKREKESIVKAVPGQSVAIEKIIGEKKLKLKNDAAVVELINALNKN